MAQTKLEKLTPAQEALIPVYRQKWGAIASSTVPIERQKAEAAVKAVYEALDKKAPAIWFFSSPYAALSEILKQSPSELAQQLGAPLLTMTPLSLELSGQIPKQIELELWQQLKIKLVSGQSEQLTQTISIVAQQLGQQLSEQQQQVLWQLLERLREQLIAQLWQKQQELMRSQFLTLPGGNLLVQMGDFFWQQAVEPLWINLAEPFLDQLRNFPPIQEWEREFKQPLLQMVDSLGLVSSLVQFNTEAASAAITDYSISVLNCTCDLRKWSALQSLVSECGWVIPFEKICFVCDRPIKLSLDTENRLHAEGEPALQYSDGFRLYVYRNAVIPEKYGKLHPNRWQSQWLLEEPNAELRRVLIQGIGYSRICLELQAEELDTWREYTLLKIDSEIDVEPIHLLKMTCPSTGYIHAHRVPPDVETAREAIRWVNWGTDPEEFSVET